MDNTNTLVPVTAGGWGQYPSQEVRGSNTQSSGSVPGETVLQLLMSSDTVPSQTSVVAPQFKCDVCNFATAQEADLKNHTSLHHDGLQFKCDKCDFSSTFEEELSNHKRRHHGVYKSSCDKCEYTPSSNDEISQHMNHRHPAQLPLV